MLVSKEGAKIEDMSSGARIGTGSLRRGFQLRNLFPHMEIVPLRGNLDTRIRKIHSENLDGIIVAAAGMRRMGWTDRITQYIPVEIMLPSVGQGVLGIEMRTDDTNTRKAVSFINHPQYMERSNRGTDISEKTGRRMPVARRCLRDNAGKHFDS